MVVLFEVSLDALQFFLFHDPLVHPELQFVVVLPNLHADPVHGVGVLVLGADETKDAVLPQPVGLLLVNTHLHEPTTDIRRVLPFGLDSILEEVHVTI